MDVYGMSSPDYFPIDDLLDFSNNTHLFNSSISTDFELQFPHFPSNSSFNPMPNFNNTNQISAFSHDLSIPCEMKQSNDVAEQEWVSNFVEFDESLIQFPTNEFAGGGGMVDLGHEMSYDGGSRSKRLKQSVVGKKEMERRRCRHCASEKTPQWRSGPLGPKTLCNACGVRYKSGRLVPEYRPAASPTFVLTQHSNSHRKVMELRRQKEILREHHQYQYQHQLNKFQVC